MAVVKLSKEQIIAFGVFSWLRKQLPNADVSTLRHISVYLARTYDEIDIDKDLNLIVSMDRTMCNLLLNDGTEIRFENSSHKSLNFIVEKHDLGVCMNLLVSTQKLDDFTSTDVMGKVVYGDWIYIIGFDSYDNKICFIKTYYKNKMIENGISYFKASNNDDIGLDSINGLSYLTDVMVKLNLLYNNVKSVCKNKLVRKKCV